MSKPLRVLIGCEASGVMRRAFARLGHKVWSCDLLPAEDTSLPAIDEATGALIRKDGE